MHPGDPARQDTSLWRGLLGDGRPALGAVGAALAFAGGVAVYLGVTRQLLPHDLAYLDMTADEIEAVAGGRLMDFMVHDRVAWGGSLLAVGVMMMWLVAFPLSAGMRWAWWTLVVSCAAGMASFASHLPTGYLDTWHGVGTLALLPVVALGLWSSRSLVSNDAVALPTGMVRHSRGRQLVVATGLGLLISGVVILLIGMTTTFVPPDLTFIGLDRSDLDAISPRLVPLLAHDRIGFAGGVVVGGCLIAALGLFGVGRAARSAVTLAGTFGFGFAVAIHLAVGYTDLLHLAPSVVGPVVLAAGVVWWRLDEPPRGRA